MGKLSLSGVLPVQDAESLLDLFLLLSSFSLFSSQFLFAVEHPEFGVDLLLDNLVFHFLSFVHQLLFSLELGAGGHEVGLLPSKIVSLHLELSVESLLDCLCFLELSLGVEFVEAGGHLLPNLLWSLHIGKEFLLVLVILSCQDCC